MNGCVIPGTGIAVDFWQIQKHTGNNYFFLTHLHGDHVVGLTSTWRYPIYCSPLTAQMLAERHGLDTAFLRPLEVGQSHLVYHDQPNSLQDSQQQASQVQYGQTLTVTVVDANHCPGAVMFLFEGHFGKILYTGDFRYHPSMMDENSLLARHVGSIDRLYLDNTYCSSQCMFPSREEALGEILRIATEHSDCDIVLGLRGLGKEELVAAIALAIEEWVCVSPKTLSLATSLGLPDVFKTAEPDLRIRVVPFHSVSGKTMREWNKVKRTIAILPTALYQGIDGKPFANQPDVFVVPYSDHSSYPELLEFVSKLRPVSVIPIVRGKVRGPFGVDVSDREDMSCFRQFLSKPQMISSNIVDFEQDASAATSSQTVSGSPVSPAYNFGDLFPGLATWTAQNKPVKRSRSKRPLKRKISVSKGISYLPDGDDREVDDKTDRIRKKNYPDTDSNDRQKDKCRAETESCMMESAAVNSDPASERERTEISTERKASCSGRDFSVDITTESVSSSDSTGQQENFENADSRQLATKQPTGVGDIIVLDDSRDTDASMSTSHQACTVEADVSAAQTQVNSGQNEELSSTKSKAEMISEKDHVETRAFHKMLTTKISGKSTSSDHGRRLLKTLNEVFGPPVTK